jgi:HSP20 family molecular chaperone IbpA
MSSQLEFEKHKAILKTVLAATLLAVGLFVEQNLSQAAPVSAKQQASNIDDSEAMLSKLINAELINTEKTNTDKKSPPEKPKAKPSKGQLQVTVKAGEKLLPVKESLQIERGEVKSLSSTDAVLTIETIEDKDNFKVIARIKGALCGRVEIALDQENFSIKGFDSQTATSAKPDKEPEKGELITTESSTSFERAFSLPFKVASDKAQALVSNSSQEIEIILPRLEKSPGEDM